MCFARPLRSACTPVAARASLSLAHHVGDVLLAIQSALVQQLGDLLVLVGLEVAEGQVFQFPLDMPDTQAVGQRCIDVEDFTGDAVALLLVGVLHRADRAGALGQFDQGDANVVDHRHQHLAQVLHLCLGAQHHGMARIEAGADRRHAQDALDQLGHHRPEALVDRLEGDLAFAYATVDDRGDQGLLVQLEVRENLGDLQARLETGGAFRPGVLCGDGSLFGFASELASLQQALTIEPGDEVLDVVQPGSRLILPSVLTGWCALTCTILPTLYHGARSPPMTAPAFSFGLVGLRRHPSLPRTAMASTCAVCGNMSRIPARFRR